MADAAYIIARPLIENLRISNVTAVKVTKKVYASTEWDDPQILLQKQRPLMLVWNNIVSIIFL